MAAFSSILAAGALLAGAVGTGASVVAARDQKKEAEKQTAEAERQSKKREQERKDQETIDSATRSAFEQRRRQRSRVGGGVQSATATGSLGLPGGAGEYQRKTILSEVA